MPLEYPDWSMMTVRPFVASSDLGTKANPIVIHVEENHSYSEIEQLSYDGDTSD
jgi:hypothetical protein